MTKQTLQALSAVPRSKIVATDSWVLSKKKPRPETYNYQHWLIQVRASLRVTDYVLSVSFIARHLCRIPKSKYVRVIFNTMYFPQHLNLLI